jgi:hypothetical protein
MNSSKISDLYIPSYIGEYWQRSLIVSGDKGSDLDPCMIALHGLRIIKALVPWKVVVGGKVLVLPVNYVPKSDSDVKVSPLI